jgi:hypothetical protein
MDSFTVEHYASSNKSETAATRFLHHTHRRNLDVINKIQQDPNKYQKLLAALPPICVEKYPDCLDSTSSRINTLIHLFSGKHNGEITEVLPDQFAHPRFASWKLVSILPGSASKEFDHAQLFCLEKHNAIGSVGDGTRQYGHVVTQEGNKLLSRQCNAAAARNTNYASRDFAPMWTLQSNRVVVPCRNSCEFEWRRTGWCTSLGLLFEHLGTHFDAAVLYEYYLMNRIVALKRYNPKPKAKSGRGGEQKKRQEDGAAERYWEWGDRHKSNYWAWY